MKSPSLFYLLIFVILASIACNTQSENAVDSSSEKPKIEEQTRNLFIIGGGAKPEGMIQFIMDSCVVLDGPIVVLPWASSEPDTSAFYVKEDFQQVSSRPILTFTSRPSELSESDLEQLANAALIYITGGDQSRFMEAIEGTEIISCIKRSQARGSCVAGTSAGAAMMSHWMITGDENYEEEYHSTYNKIWVGNAIFSKGLGLLDDAIIDQHFVARSRYNRLFSAMCEHPKLLGIGIDESTAAWIKGSTLTVVGESQVIIFHPPVSVNSDSKYFSAEGIRIDILVAGEKMQME